MIWQPIETAPKDGTIFDVWLGTISNPEDALFYLQLGSSLRSTCWQWREGKFRPALEGLSVLPTFIQPTHWMPIPKGPD